MKVQKSASKAKECAYEVENKVNVHSEVKLSKERKNKTKQQETKMECFVKFEVVH